MADKTHACEMTLEDRWVEEYRESPAVDNCLGFIVPRQVFHCWEKTQLAGTLGLVSARFLLTMLVCQHSPYSDFFF